MVKKSVKKQTGGPVQDSTKIKSDKLMADRLARTEALRLKNKAKNDSIMKSYQSDMDMVKTQTSPKKKAGGSVKSKKK